MRCDANCDNGEVYSQVTGKWATCSVCDGSGEIEPCTSPGFAGSMAFRNPRCTQCGAKRSSHNEQLMEA